MRLLCAFALAWTAAAQTPAGLFDDRAVQEVGQTLVTPQFAGLAAGFIGLDQINALVPEGANDGPNPLRLIADGVGSEAYTPRDALTCFS